MEQGTDSWELVATCTRGLEEVVRRELDALGHPEAESGRGVVRFRGGWLAVCRANLWLRSAMRVLRHLTDGPAPGRDALYHLAAAVPWEEVLTSRSTFAVAVAGRSSGFRSEGFAALTVKDAIADRLRERLGARPDVQRSDPDVAVHLHLAGELADLSLDSSGAPLSHRGYRPRGGPAPLAETLAAGVLQLAGYDGSQPLLDPMTGTGTIAIEAALIATGTAPGQHRRFGFERWPGHEAERFAAERESAARRRRRAAAAIVACDDDPRAVAAARRNASAAGVGTVVEVCRRNALELVSPGEGGLIVCNPPYGDRLGVAAELGPLYRSLGDALKRRGAGATAWLLVGNADLVKAIGLRPASRTVLFNGPIECRLLRFDLYSGSRRRPREAGSPPAGG